MPTMTGLQIEQISAILNAVVKQATGQIPTIDTTDTKNFVSVAQALLKTGYDPVINAISQVLSRTIFSVRPYTRKFRGLEVDAQRWGNHVRKINYIDQEFENDDRLPLTDGTSVDPWIIKKPKVLQTNFYGQVVFQRHITLFKDQLDTAMSSPAEFGNFISGVLQNVSDQIEQGNEELDRGAVANLIGGTVHAAGDNVYHLLTEYNTYLGRSGQEAYTAETVRDPAVYPDFIKFVYARVKNITALMAERSVKFHMLPKDGQGNDLPLMRHTPAERLKMYLYDPQLNEIDAHVLSGLYHDDRLKFADHESVTYWQNIEDPMSIKVNASMFDPDTGGIAETGEITVNNIFGVLFDEDALGVTTINQWSQNTGMNPRGGYYSIFWHWTRRYYCDSTENAAVLLLD